MAYYDALVAQWASLTGTTQQKLDVINALTVPGPNVPVPVLQVMTYLRTNNLWLQIKSAQATSPGAAAAVDYNTDPRVQTIDMTLPIVQLMVADLVAHTLLTTAQALALAAMATTTTPWSQANGYNTPISGQDLVNAGLQSAVPVTPLGATS